MAMPIGTVDDQGRKYYRCLHCGDSKKRPYIAHAFIDRNGNTYCYRCQHSTRLSIDEYISYILDNDYDLEETLWTPPANPVRCGTGRETLLTKYIAEDVNADAFAMRNQYGDLIGWHTRFVDKKMHNEGKRGISWPGDADGVELRSSFENPLKVVEGPYDVLTDKSISVYGAISYSSMKNLSCQHVVVWPDPDMLDSKYKRAAFVRMMEIVNDNTCFVHGLYVSNADPDKATKVKYVSLKDAIKHVKQEAMYV